MKKKKFTKILIVLDLSFGDKNLAYIFCNPHFPDEEMKVTTEIQGFVSQPVAMSSFISKRRMHGSLLRVHNILFHVNTLKKRLSKTN